MGDRANINTSYGGRQSGADGEAIMAAMGGAGGSSAATPLPQTSAIFDQLSADTLTGLSNGDAVSSWVGIKGAMAATQITPANQPLYRTNSLNGKPAIQAIATDQTNSKYMTFGTNTALNTALSASQSAILFVFHSVGAGRNGQDPIFSAGVPGELRNWVVADGTNVGRYSDTTPDGLTGFHTLLIVQDSTSSPPRLRVAINGMFVSILVNTFGSTATAYDLFRGTNSGNDFFSTAKLSDVVVWTGVKFTQPNAIQAHKWACDKYAQEYPWAGLSHIKVIAGDSIPSAAGIAHTNNVYNLLKADLGFAHGQVCIIATPSISLTAMQGQLQDDLDGIPTQTGLPYRLFLGEYANSYAASSPATVPVAAMTTLLNDRQAARASGSKISVWDSTGLGAFALGNASGDQTGAGGPTSNPGLGRLNYNSQIAALTSLFDNFQAVSGDANIGVIGSNPYNGTWPMTYFKDEKHLTAAGMVILKNFAKAGFTALGA